jgi:hypothetical protein
MKPVSVEGQVSVEGPLTPGPAVPSHGFAGMTDSTHANTQHASGFDGLRSRPGQGVQPRAQSLLPVRAEGFDPHHYDLAIGHLVSRYRDRLGDEALAAFADEQAGLLELIRLPAATEARLEVGTLLLAPIERLLERFPPALVAVVDKEEARVFGAVLGEVVPLGHPIGLHVKHDKAGGSSASSHQRKAENRAQANLVGFVSTIERELRAGSYQRIYIAGPDEARAEFVKLLPPALRRLVAGRLSASLDSAQLQHELREQVQRTARGV